MPRVIIEIIPDVGDVIHATAEVEPGAKTKKLNPKAEKTEQKLTIHENLLPDSFDLTINDGDKVTIKTDAKQRLHYDAAQGTVTKVDKEPEKEPKEPEKPADKPAIKPPIAPTTTTTTPAKPMTSPLA